MKIKIETIQKINSRIQKGKYMYAKALAKIQVTASVWLVKILICREMFYPNL